MPIFKKKKIEERVLPEHIAIIMDGNGRWAKKRSLPRTAGHAAGSKNFKDIARYCNKIGLKYLTVYAFSTENWKRPKEEVDNIMKIFKEYLEDAKNFKDENIQVDFAEGDTVAVIAGVWKDTVGVIQTMNYGKQIVTINVDLFGRETPVEISFTEIKKM